MRARPCRLFVLICLIAPALPASAARQQPPATVWDGVYTSEQAARGEARYGAVCATCHGDDLGGIETAPALTGIAFNGNWNGTPLAALVERIRTSMPPDRPRSLSRADTADLVAYLLDVAGIPPGTSPLGSDDATLAGIVFQSRRPEP